MLTTRHDGGGDDVRWAFWRGQTEARPARALPDDVGLPTASRPSAAPPDRAAPPDDDDRDRPATPARTSGAVPSSDPHPTTYEPPLVAADDVDRTALAAAGSEVARLVEQARTGGSTAGGSSELAVAATGALAARLPALSGVDGDVALDEAADELLHAYADLLVARAESRRADVDREDLLAVAHLAAAATAADAAAEPALLRLAGVPAGAQLAAAVLLLAQTADDGGGAPDLLPQEIDRLFDVTG